MSGLLSRILGSGAHRKGAADPVVLYDDGVHGSMWEDADASYFRVLKRQDVTRGNKHVVLKVDPSGIVIMDKHMQNDLSYHPFASTCRGAWLLRCFSFWILGGFVVVSKIHPGLRRARRFVPVVGGLALSVSGPYTPQILRRRCLVSGL